MSNRKQRRAVNKMQHDPKVKEYVDKFAMDISKMLVDHFGNMNPELATTSFDDSTKEMMKQKGNELGTFIEGIVRDLGKDFEKENKQQQNRNQINIILSKR